MQSGPRLVKGYDLTMPLDGAVRIRGYRPTQVLRSRTTLDGLQRISELQLSPHTLTHIDLLSRVDWSCGDLAGVAPDLAKDSSNRTEYGARLLQNRVMSCTIVLLEAFARRMREACARQWPTRLPGHPHAVWPEAVFRSLVHELRVTRKSLVGTSIGRGDFVIFYTRWRQFAPPDGDLTHASWYPWHPYLMNPYLEEAAVDYLLDDRDGLSAAGIGCDIGTLDCCLRHHNPLKDSNYLGMPRSVDYFDGCARQHEFWPSDSLKGEWRFSPVHVGTLRRKKLLVEQLHIPAIVMKTLLHGALVDFPEAAESALPTLRGKLVLLPHQCSEATDAVLVSAMFVPMEACHADAR